MIPTEEQARALWDKYNLPERKRKHVQIVAKVADELATKCQRSNVKCQINRELLRAGALLHDIDKNIPRLPGEQHPDTGVRILREEGMEEVANLVKIHSLHAILDPAMCPSSWEEKILYLSDKMVKDEIITVDRRFALWRREQLSQDAVRILDESYPRVKQLEKEIFSQIHIDPADVSRLATD